MRVDVRDDGRDGRDGHDGHDGHDDLDVRDVRGAAHDVAHRAARCGGQETRQNRVPRHERGQVYELACQLEVLSSLSRL